jgi:hypothetical protein
MKIVEQLGLVLCSKLGNSLDFNDYRSVYDKISNVKLFQFLPFIFPVGSDPSNSPLSLILSFEKACFLALESTGFGSNYINYPK